MAGQYLYTTKGYNGGWSAAATDLRRSAGGGSWPSVADGNKSAFYRTAGGTWRRFFSGINSDGLRSGYSASFYSDPGQGVAEVTFNTNGTITDTAGSAPWDPSGYPDNPDIEIYATLTSGYTPYSLNMNTWYTLNTARTFTLILDSGLSGQSVINVQFRHIPTGITLANIPVTLYIEYISG